MADEALSPEELLIRKEEVTHLREAMAQLREEQQHVLILRFVEGMSHAQVAQIIRRSEGAVRVIQHRVLAALGDILRRSREDG